MKYILMHREIKVAELEIDELSHITDIGQVFDIAHFPIGTVNKIGVDRRILSKWWETRSIPASRSGIKEALRQINMFVPEELIDKCYGLSLSDQYWICPENVSLMWKDINFFDNAFSEDVGNLLFGRAEDTHDMNLMSPDNTSDGQLIKKWKIVDGKRVLIKGSSKPYCQEALCEVIASEIADRLNINHVKYRLILDDGQLYSACEDFVTRDTELIGMSHIMRAFKKPNYMTEYDFAIDCLEQLGIDNARADIEKMLVLDFVIANEDRHYNNFGVLRNAITLEWLGLAPVFDCGTSLWYNTQTRMIKPTSDALSAKPFKKTQQEQIELVTDFSWIDFEALRDIHGVVDEILSKSDLIDNERRDMIIDGLCMRIDMLEDMVQSINNSQTERLIL